MMISYCEQMEVAVTDDNAQLELIKQTNRVVDSLSAQLGQLGRELSANQQSTTGLWHEVSGVKRRLDKLNTSLKGMINDHEEDCIARQIERQRAISAKEEPSVSFNLQPAKPSVDSTAFHIPKTALWIALLLGALLVGGGIVIGAAWTGGQQKAGEVIRDLGTKTGKSVNSN